MPRASRPDDTEQKIRGTGNETDRPRDSGGICLLLFVFAHYYSIEFWRSDHYRRQMKPGEYITFIFFALTANISHGITWHHLGGYKFVHRAKNSISSVNIVAFPRYFAQA